MEKDCWHQWGKRGGRWGMPLLTLFLLMGLGVERASSCSVRWSEPHNRYPSLNEKGIYELFYTIGHLSLDDEKPLPLILSFSPVYPPSRFFSSNFNLFIFDARMYPLSEREYECIYPDGWTYHYWAGKDKNILNGSSGWKAEISKNAAGNPGNIINLFANCGGWRMTFTGGRITTIKTPKNKLIDVVMLGDKAGEIRVNGSTALRIQMDAREGRSGEMIFKDGKRNKFELGSKPLVLVGADKKREIKGEELSLRRMTLADGTVIDYVFGVDESKQPTLKVSSTGKDDHLYTWDASSRYLLSDAVCGTAETNTWNYVVKPGAKPQDNAACIEKRDAKGELVSAWKASPGREETFEKGVWNIKSMFAGGTLAGRIRKIERRDKDEKVEVVYRATYSEKGELIREINEKGEITTFKYEMEGKQITAMRDNELLWQKRYDDKGRIVFHQRENGEVASVEYFGNNNKRWVTVGANGNVEKAVYEGKEVRERTFSNGEKYRYKYYADGSLMEMIDANGTWNFKYDPKNGQISEMYKDGKLCRKTFEDFSKKREVSVSFNSDGSIEGGYDIAKVEAVPLSEVKIIVARKAPGCLIWSN
ncbi:MAG: hypothetical protein PHV34_21295 [Verrucomicrobiae bacterium]|nr:hypothetical protein [Verrucomicrobiae bacterium]